MASPTIIGIGGFTSNTGKTSLLCELLRLFPGWEAIKTTRGHYRSCGKDPHTCCVSDLLGEEALIRSGREETYAAEKDSGRYWDAGAANVHWVIATEDQVSTGIRRALERVTAQGVFVEGNTFSKFVEVDLMIMVARATKSQIKSSAREAITRASAFYLTGEESLEANPFEELHFRQGLNRFRLPPVTATIPVYTSSSVAKLAQRIQCARCLPKY